jgi:hypothetical protein
VPGHALEIKNLPYRFIVPGDFQMLKSVGSTPHTYQKLLYQLFRSVPPDWTLAPAV